MNRPELLARLSDRSEPWDVIVVGGGATGLGIAVDAATRGYRTALLEQADFAGGTSSKSTKLIHGGVRYLRGGEVGLVRESLRERGRLLRNAPSLVKPQRFIVPAYRWYEPFFYGSGLTLYDLLAGDLGIGSTGHLSKLETVAEAPNLSPHGLRGSTLYWDGQFDDARLALALARTAIEHGAAVVNHLEVKELIQEGGKTVGVAAVDRLDGKEFRLKGKAVVNATGVFSDTLRRMDDPTASESIEPSQGIHLVLDGAFLGGETAVMIPRTDDGRVLFAIPWLGKVLLGTTDTGSVGIELHPTPLEEEVDYLLSHAARYLVEPPSRSVVRSIFAGLRPLVRPSGADAENTARISRSHNLSMSRSGLITIAGGKWTTYRQMAEDVVDLACETFDLPVRPCVSAELPLSPGLEQGQGDFVDADLPYTIGDIDRAIAEEMAMTVDDVLSRRTRCSFLDTAAALRMAPTVAERMARALGRESSWIERELDRFRHLRMSEIAHVPETVGS